MSSQSEYAGTVGTGNFSATQDNWTSPTNAEGAPSGSFATVTMLHGANSYSLDAYNFGFSVSGTINGLVGGCTAKESSVGGNVEFLATYVAVDSTNGAFTANLLASTTMTTTATTYSVGSSTDTCGFTGTQLSAANVNTNTENAGPTWGFTVKNISGSLSFAASIEGMELTCYYTAGSVPGPPTFTIANDNSNPTTALDLTITAGTGSPTGFTIQQASTIGGTFTTIATNVSSPYTVSGLTPGTEYAFQVAGVNGSGTGSYCSPVAWATEPTVPTSFSSPSASATAINVSFLFPSIGSNLSQTCEYRYETPVGAGNWVSGNIGSGSSPITGLSPLTQYGIEIASVIQSTNSDWAGTIQGPWTSEITVITPPMPHATTFPISTAVRMSTTY